MSTTLPLVAAIPSPDSGALSLGPLTLHAYGLFIALAALAAVRLSRKRWAAQGYDDEDITTVALWGIPAGIVGARIYHVITDNELYRDNPVEALYLWDGGLGIWGGIAAGVIVGLLVARKKNLPLLKLLDTVAPGLALAQAIGRFGNYFNQELFGRPTDMPWALQIDPENRPAGLEEATTFHPTFAYEALWNSALCLALIFIGKRLNLKPGRIFLLYVAGYTFVRFFIEGLRVDSASVLLGMRVNEVVSAVVFLTCVALSVVLRPHRATPATNDPPTTERTTTDSVE